MGAAMFDTANPRSAAEYRACDPETVAMADALYEAQQAQDDKLEKQIDS